MEWGLEKVVYVCLWRWDRVGWAEKAVCTCVCGGVFEQQTFFELSPGVEEGNNKASVKFSSPSSLTLTSSLSSLFPSSPPSFYCPLSCLLPSCSLFLPFSLSFLRSCYESPAGLQLTVPSLQSPECWDDNLNFCSWLSSSCCPVLYGSDVEGQPWGLWSLRAGKAGGWIRM